MAASGKRRGSSNEPQPDPKTFGTGAVQHWRVVGDRGYHVDDPAIPMDKRGRRLGWNVTYDPKTQRFAGDPRVVNPQGRLIPKSERGTPKHPKPPPSIWKGK